MKFQNIVASYFNFRVATCAVALIFILGSSAAGRQPKLPANELPDYDPAEFKDLDAIVGDARIVNFGESSHFLRGMHLAATRMFRYLVERKDFRVFVFESAWGVDEAMQEFLKSNRTELLPDDQLFLNAFNSKPTIEMLLWIREFNRLNPNDQIRLAGFQPEQPVTDFNALFAFASHSEKFAAADLRTKTAACKASSGEYKTNIEFVSYSGKLRRAGKPTYTTEERAACNQGIDAIANFIEQNRKELIKRTSLNDYRESQAHLISLRAYLNGLMGVMDAGVVNKNPTEAQRFEYGRQIYEEGDKARFEIFRILDETRYKDKRVMFWMHDWHAMKHSPEVYYDDNIPKGTTSVGTRLANFYGSKLIAIGSVTACPQCKKPVRADSLEAKFAAALPGVKSAIISTKNPAPQYRDLPLNVPGSLLVQIDETHLLDVVLSRQFDAVYYLSESKFVFDK